MSKNRRDAVGISALITLLAILFPLEGRSQPGSDCDPLLIDPCGEPVVESDYDEFSEESSWRLPLQITGLPDDQRITIYAELKKHQELEVLRAVVIYSGPDWIFLENTSSHLIFLTDGGRIATSAVNVERDVGASRVYEIAAYLLTPDDFQQIIASNTVRVRVEGARSNIDFDLPAAYASALRSFYENVVLGAGRPAPN